MTVTWPTRAESRWAWTRIDWRCYWRRCPVTGALRPAIRTCSLMRLDSGYFLKRRPDLGSSLASIGWGGRVVKPRSRHLVLVQALPNPPGGVESTAAGARWIPG